MSYPTLTNSTSKIKKHVSGETFATLFFKQKNVKTQTRKSNYPFKNIS